MLIFWFSQSPTDHCLVLTIPPPPPPLSLFLLSDWASSPALKIVGDLLDLASCVGWWPQHCTWHQLLPVTDTVLWPACRATIVSHIIICWGGVGTCLYLLQCYNILHILYTMWQTSPDRYLLLFSWSEDLNWLPDHLTTRTTAGGGEGGKKNCWRLF